MNSQVVESARSPRPQPTSDDRIPSRPRHAGELRDFVRFALQIGVRELLYGHVDYVRCIEFPLVFRHLALKPGGRLLDVGSGDSHFPLYVASRSDTTVVALDASRRVLWQKEAEARFVRQGIVPDGRLHVVIADARDTSLGDEEFDYITLISTIEHIEGDGDSAAIREMARLLKPGGRIVLTVPYNYDRYRDFWVSEDTYTAVYRGARLFYQRHYDDDALTARLVKPSGLRLATKVIFGEPGWRCFNTLFANPRLPVLAKAPYLWAMPLLARRFARILREQEIRTKEDLPMVTTEGALLVLENPARA
jgi:SAM-dependent methyltransferase